MVSTCQRCSARATRRLAFRVRVDGVTLERGAALCDAHELERVCETCDSPTPDPADPFCATCRRAVEFGAPPKDSIG